MGGSLQGTQGLLAEFGPRRIREAPISESAMVGAAIGAALFGQRPIVEISFGEFMPAAMNQLINQAPNLHYMTGGVARVPLVVRTRVGDGPYGGHPQDYSAWFAHVPGLKVVMPAQPGRRPRADAERDPRRQSGAVLRGDVAGARAARAGRRLTRLRADRPGPCRARGPDVTVAAIGSMVPAEPAGGRYTGRRGHRGGSHRPALDSAAGYRLRRRVGAAHGPPGHSPRGVGDRRDRAPRSWRRSPRRAPARCARRWCGWAPRAVPTPSGKVRPHALPNAERIVAAVRRVLATWPTRTWAAVWLPFVSGRRRSRGDRAAVRGSVDGSTNCPPWRVADLARTS